MSATHIDRYEIRRGLGRGAMGDVYLAFDPKIGREVAIKVLQQSFARTSKYRQRFDREAHAIAALHHPNIVQLYDYGDTPDGSKYLVMEYLRGHHVGHHCREQGPLPESVVGAIGGELAAALAEAHGAGIIHRDLKPENVFLHRGRVVLADFGIVKAVAEENPLGADAAAPRTEIIGTPGFMAPEQLEQTPLDARTDIFAFGALMYYLATGKLPYSGDSPVDLLKQFKDTRPEPVHHRRSDVSERLGVLIQDCLEVNPHHRPDAAGELRRRFMALLDWLGVGDVREHLAAFEANPDGFRNRDNERIVAHLTTKLRAAVRAKDGLQADEIRQHIARLAPDNAEAQRVTGMGELMASQPRETDPEIVLARSSRRRKLAAGVLATAVALGAGAWFAYRQPSDDAPAAAAASAESQPRVRRALRVRATHKTHVFANGRALGSTPNFPKTALPPGAVELELVRANGGQRLAHQLSAQSPTQNELLSVFVNWNTQRVAVKRKPDRVASQ